MIWLSGAYGTNSITLSNFKLSFKDGSNLTIQQAVNNNYIKPLVIISSSAQSSTYVFTNYYSIKDGTAVVGSYSIGNIFIRVTNKSYLTGCSFDSANNFGTIADGVEIREYPEDTRISLSPLQ